MWSQARLNQPQSVLSNETDLHTKIYNHHRDDRDDRDEEDTEVQQEPVYSSF